MKLLLPLLLVSAICSAQIDPANYLRKDLKVENGLPQNSIVRVVKDDNGYYWILTYTGAVRWNGTSLNSKLLTAPDTLTLPNLKIYSYYNGRLCFRNGAAYWYGVNQESKLERIEPPKGTQLFRTGYYPCQVGAIDEQDIALIYANTEKKLADTFLYEFKENWFNCGMYTISDREFYFLMKKCLYHCLNGKMQYLNSYRGDVHPLLVNDKVCVVSPDGVTDLYDHGKLVSRKKFDWLQLDTMVAGRPNWWSIQQKPGSPAVAGIQDKIVEFRINIAGELEAIKKFHLPNWIDYFCMHYDTKQDQLLLGSTLRGCEFYWPRRIQTLTSRGGRDEQIVYTMAPTNSGGIVTGHALFNQIRPNNKTLWEWGAIGDMLRLKNGDLVFGKGDSLVYLSADGKKRKSWKVGFAVLEMYQIDSLLVYNTGNLGVIDLATAEQRNELTYWPQLSGGVSFIAPSYISKWKLYVSLDNRLALLDVKERQVKMIGDEKIPGCRSICFDTALRRFIITTDGKGLFLADLNGHIIPLPSNGNQELQKVHYVATDRDGDFWLPTNAGIFLLQRQQLRDFLSGKIQQPTYFRFDRSDGIENDEFNGGFRHCYLYRNDTFYMGSMGGVVRFSPTALKSVQQNSPGRMIIDGVWIDDVASPVSDQITLSPYFKELRIHADAAFFQRPGTKLQYRIVGMGDSLWNFVNLGDVISIKYTRPGDYRLEMRVVSDFREVSKVIRFRVEPFWYNTWWAYSILFILLIVTFVLFTRWRSFSHQRQTEKAIQQNRQQLFTIISHDLRSPVNTYLGLTDTLTYLIDANDQGRLKQVAGEIDRAGRKLSLLMNNLFNWSISEQELLNVRTETFDYGVALQEVLAVYEPTLEFRSLRIINQNEIAGPVHTDKKLLALIHRNMIDNALKNAPEGSSVQINSIVQDNTIHFTVANALSPEGADKLNRLKQLLHSSQRLEPGENGIGFGFAMMNNIVLKLDGQIRVSHNEKEVTISVQVPMHSVASKK